MELLPWEGKPIPGNANALGTCRLSNGVYALYHPGGQLKFLCRVVSGQIDCWLNLYEDGCSGHLDEGNTGEAYYADGRMETFSPWDDSPPFRAKLSFAEWKEKALAVLTRPIPESARDYWDIQRDELRAACAKSFGQPPGNLAPEELRLRTLGFLRRCELSLPTWAQDLRSWRSMVIDRAAMPEAWVNLFVEELPICATARPGLWEPDWGGVFGWRALEPSWFLRSVLAFNPSLPEMSPLRNLAAFPGPGAGQPVCRLRALILACELLCQLGEAKDSTGLAKGMEPEGSFQPELAPWTEFPELLEVWRRDWQAAGAVPPSPRQRSQLQTILERLAC